MVWKIFLKKFLTVRLGESLQIIVRLWDSTSRAQKWTIYILIWRAWVFQNDEFFLHIPILVMTLRYIQIVRLLYKSISLGSLNILFENLTRSIIFFFSFSTPTYDYPHHGNNQINICAFLKTRKTWIISISDTLEYVHGTVFLHFWKSVAASPTDEKVCIIWHFSLFII